ncbi:hypothetical protein A5724_23650 [Mycobacterium sp. ACS1612]|uniref:hypothetical protein n=1 Tax=Mycobacterium sp. ACS1612 TaxID=1834117 RepID=UPI0007FD1661|nr:hypothetical protein [Mycobacterium sp. ACS1612]OBF30221.1 hypothetical protein A5724_23650 [Mycobacterium sp. ACS1612]
MATSNSGDDKGDTGNGGGGSGNSGSSGNGGAGGNSGDSGGGGDTGNPTGASITDLTGDLKKFSDAGSPNLHFTPESSKKLVALIKTYKEQLQYTRSYMDSIDEMGNEGDLPSAHATKQNLLYDINGPGGAKDMAQKCIDYLDALQDAVGKAGASIEHHG